MKNSENHAMIITLTDKNNKRIQFSKVGEDITIEKLNKDGSSKEVIGMAMNKTIGNDFEKFEAFCTNYVNSLDKFFRNCKCITLIDVDDDGMVTLDFEKGDTYSVTYDARFGEITEILLNSEVSLMSEYKNELDEIVAIIKGIESLQEIIEETLSYF